MPYKTMHLFRITGWINYKDTTQINHLSMIAMFLHYKQIGSEPILSQQDV